MAIAKNEVKSIKENLVYVKNRLKSNAENILHESLSKDIEESNLKTRESNAQIISQLNEQVGIPYTALTNFSLETYQEERPSITKFSYKFPGIISLGRLRNWRGVPSKIANEEFESSIPLLLPTEHSHIGIFHNQQEKETIYETLELAGLKMMASLPDGLVRATIIDPSGSGQNFPRIITLSKKIITDILTDDDGIDRAMQDFKQSMSIVTQSIAQNGFSSIEEYNNNTDEIPQPYRFIFIANFPTGFNKRSAEALISLLDSGTAAGFHIFLTFSAPQGATEKHDIISGISLGNFMKNMSIFEFSHSKTANLDHSVMMLSAPLKTKIKNFYNSTYSIDFEYFSEKDVKGAISDMNDKISNMSLRPIISILKTIPDKKDFWKEDASAGICAPFAKSGIEDIYFSLGVNKTGESEAVYHALIGGSTGSGKTVALNDIILHTAMAYSPEEVEFWLLDYKEGTEFAIYKDFPYVKILSVESEIEFGHDVLTKAIRLIEERGEIFKQLNVSSLDKYNDAIKELNETTGNNLKKLSRIILIIDEFQVLFPNGKPKISQKTNDLITDIVRRGRSFGINLILSTQTLKDLDIDSSILSNMPLRVAFKMDEKDAVKFFSEGNQAPKFLSFPGEGILNAAHGLNGKNIFFQAYLTTNDDLKNIQQTVLDKMNDTYSKDEIKTFYKDRFVYNGDLEGNVKSNKHYDLNKVQEKLYIGESSGFSMSHAFLTFKKQFGDHFLSIGEDFEKAASNMGYLLEQLSCSSENYDIRFGCFYPNYEEYFHHIAQNGSKRNNVQEIVNATIETHINEIYDEFATRLDKVVREGKKTIKDLKQIFLILFYTSNIPILKSASYNANTPKGKFVKLIDEGSEYGIHICLYVPNYSAYSSIDLATKSSSFGKKLIFKDGSGIKTLSDNYSEIEFSKSDNVAIFQNNTLGNKISKIKPYVDKRIKDFA